MRTPRTRWLVKVVTTRGGQVRKFHQPMKLNGPGPGRRTGRSAALSPSGHKLLGDEAFEQLTDVRKPRFD